MIETITGIQTAWGFVKEADIPGWNLSDIPKRKNGNFDMRYAKARAAIKAATEIAYRRGPAASCEQIAA